MIKKILLYVKFIYLVEKNIYFEKFNFFKNFHFILKNSRAVGERRGGGGAGGGTIMGVEWGECQGVVKEGGGKKQKIRRFRALYGEIKKIIAF